MPHKVRIALDAMGGDHGAAVVVPGAELSLSRHPDIEFFFFGDRAAVEPLVDARPQLKAASRLSSQKMTLLKAMFVTLWRQEPVSAIGKSLRSPLPKRSWPQAGVLGSVRTSTRRTA